MTDGLLCKLSILLACKGSWECLIKQHTRPVWQMKRIRSGSICHGIVRSHWVLQPWETVGRLHLCTVAPFLRTFQQPNSFCRNRSTTNLFIISFLSRTIDFSFFFLSLWIYLWLAETSQQPISQTTWLKVTPHCNPCNPFSKLPLRCPLRHI